MNDKRSMVVLYLFNFPKAEKSYLKKSDMERLQITAIQLEATEVELNKQKHLKRPFSLVLRGMRGIIMGQPGTLWPSSGEGPSQHGKTNEVKI